MRNRDRNIVVKVTKNWDVSVKVRVSIRGGDSVGMQMSEYWSMSIRVRVTDSASIMTCV